MKPSDSFKTLPFLARYIIVLFAATGFAMAAFAIRSESVTNPGRMIFLLLVAALTARAKTAFYQQATISFLTSVVMIAVISEGLAVSLLVAVCGVTIQTVLPSRKVAFHRLIFNLGMISLTVTAAWWTHHVFATNAEEFSSEVVATVLASSVYFIVNSISVALIVATTQIGSVFEVWTKHFIRSAPSFVSAGLLALGLVGLLISGSLPYKLLSSWSLH
jgi:hypothetical protein